MSITLDRFMQMEYPVYSDPSDPRVSEWCRHWGSRPGFEKLDTIRVTEAEADKFVTPLGEMKMGSITLMEKPALREFELIVSEPVPSVNMTVVRYKKSILPAEPVIVPGDGGNQIEMVPCIDAFMSFRNAVEVDSVMTIFTFRALDKNGNVTLTGTMQKEFWRNYDLRLNYTMDRDYSMFTEIMRDIKLVYLGIQKAIYEKPVIFTETSGSKAPQSTGSGRNQHGRRKAGIAKIICVNQKELKKICGIAQAYDMSLLGCDRSLEDLQKR